MMMSSKKKDTVGSILASLPKAPTPSEEPAEKYDGHKAAAEDLISSVHAKDAEGVKRAMKSLYELNRNEDNSSDDSHETGPFMPDEEQGSAS